ncbi:PhzF family phenazine biosynthesis protein [Halomonas sp. BM-2019]|uniref:PhzF family phenazine biosynthesis protein n=1 Tax=Halomonas sp. BM-2019 TaxID=2811227 RepID=UPI0031FDEA7E
MDFPAKLVEPMADPEPVLAALGVAQGDVVMTDDIVVAVDNEAIVAALAPDMAKLAALPGRGVVVTAPGREFDFVSRWFGPKVGVEEDPVTGSAHTTLAPYWAGRLGKTGRSGHPHRPGGALSARDDSVLRRAAHADSTTHEPPRSA